MLITIQHRMKPHERMSKGALDTVIGRPVTIEWPGGPSKAKIADAQVLDDGHQVAITLDVDGELAEFLARVIDDGMGFSL
jgi:hypothetical protein